jgi:hypothetical protein
LVAYRQQGTQLDLSRIRPESTPRRAPDAGRLRYQPGEPAL